MADSAVADAPPVSVKEPEDYGPEREVPEIKSNSFAVHMAILAFIALIAGVFAFCQIWDGFIVSFLIGAYWAFIGQSIASGHGGYLRRLDGFIYPRRYSDNFFRNWRWPFATIKDVPLEPRSDAVGVAKVMTKGKYGILGLEIGVHFKGTYVIDLSVPYDEDVLQPKAVIQNSGDMRDEAISACKRALSNVCAKLDGETLNGMQEALALMVECDLRLADRPDEMVKVPYLTDAERAAWCADGIIKPECLLMYYDRHAVPIRRRLKKMASLSRSKGEEDWAFSAYGFTVTEFDFPESVKDASEVEQKMRARAAAIKKFMDDLGMTSQEATKVYQLDPERITGVIAEGGDLAGIVAALKVAAETLGGKKGGK